MNGSRLLSSIALGSLLAWALSSAPAFADTATSGTSATSGAELEEVTVTARRERENLQVVPISITAISAEEIRQKTS